MDTKLLAGEPPIPLLIRRSAKARRISLRVSALDGRVTLTVPRGVPDHEALEFAQSKETWIRRHLAKRAGDIQVASGGHVLYRGEETPIREGNGRHATLAEGAILVPGGAEMVGPRVKAFLKAQAKSRLTERADHYAAELGRQIQKITLRDTRSRWGSCSAVGNLMFSWRLIMAPPEVLDYVAAHEAAHLIEMNHSAAYWALVAKIYPDYERQRAWLRQNGALLHRYRFGD